MHHTYFQKMAAVISLTSLLLAGCGQSQSKTTAKAKPVSFAKLANQNQTHVWLETNGENVTQDSTVAYLLVTKKGKVTVYRTGDAALSSYNRRSDASMIAKAKRADEKSFKLKREAAYATSKAKQTELTTAIKDKTIKSKTKLTATKQAIQTLKDKRWPIETTKYQAPKPRQIRVQIKTAGGKVTGEKINYGYYDYSTYFDQYTDADTWIKQGKPNTVEKPISHFFTQTDGAKVTYQHRFHHAVAPLSDQLTGYLEYQHKDKSPKKGTALLTRVTSKKTPTQFDSVATKHVTQVK